MIKDRTGEAGKELPVGKIHRLWGKAKHRTKTQEKRKLELHMWGGNE